MHDALATSESPDAAPEHSLTITSHGEVPCPLGRAKQLLANDTKVKVAGLDFDGILRGKIMAKDKFLSSIKGGGFGMSSAVFGWDMHDVLYTIDAGITSAEESYPDMTAEVDLDSMRRLPFKDNIAFFLVYYSISGKPVCADGRSMMKALEADLARDGARAVAGGKSTPY